jgi:hypothetical protein
MVKARAIKYIDDYKEVLLNPERLIQVRNDILEGDAFIFRNAVDKKFVLQIRDYLKGIGKGSLPNYNPIEVNAPNFHRINIWDDRAYVKGCFHQFTFFPWNQDLLRIFHKTKDIYYLKNLINNQPKDKFLGSEPEDGCTARLSFQFYPKGIGGLNKHSDPVDHHQLTVPSLIMSKKGEDFESGGVYIEDTNDAKIYLDDLCNIGDVVFFNAQVPHGVDIIDEQREEDWLTFEGRWMMIFATNKLYNNDQIQDAIDLETNGK